MTTERIRFETDVNGDTLAELQTLAGLGELSLNDIQKDVATELLDQSDDPTEQIADQFNSLIED